LNVGSGAGFAMVFALLLSAIIWNLGTWYYGLPASSSHALVGSILGVGLANSLLVGGHRFGEGVNWSKAAEVGTSLLVSPLVGFSCAALLLLASKALIKRKDLYSAPEYGKTPPSWIRMLLILTCTGVSFGHGSNDGQKGMGLIMLILIGIMPTVYAVNMNTSAADIAQLEASASSLAQAMEPRTVEPSEDPPQADGLLSTFLRSNEPVGDQVYSALAATCREISGLVKGKSSLAALSAKERKLLRTDLYLASQVLSKAVKAGRLTSPADLNAVAVLNKQKDSITQFIPPWVKLAVALSLGLGTMIGWKRIVITVGEKIGKQHLTYVQGAAAELVAAGTILAADTYGLPVSTTHVLSSGVAGTMAANRSGLQAATLRNLLLAWVLTLPVTVLMGAGIFAFVLNVLLRLVIS